MGPVLHLARVSKPVLPPTYPAPYGIVQHWLNLNWVSDVVVIGGNGFIFKLPRSSPPLQDSSIYGDGGPETGR